MWSNEYPTCHINNSLIVFSTSVFSTVQIKVTCTLYLARNCAVALFFSLWQLKALHPVWLEIEKWMPNMCVIGCTNYNQIAVVLVLRDDCGELHEPEFELSAGDKFWSREAKFTLSWQGFIHVPVNRIKWLKSWVKSKGKGTYM